MSITNDPQGGTPPGSDEDSHSNLLRSRRRSSRVRFVMNDKDLGSPGAGTTGLDDDIPFDDFKAKPTMRYQQDMFPPMAVNMPHGFMPMAQYPMQQQQQQMFPFYPNSQQMLYNATNGFAPAQWQVTSPQPLPQQPYMHMHAPVSAGMPPPSSSPSTAGTAALQKNMMLNSVHAATAAVAPSMVDHATTPQRVPVNLVTNISPKVSVPPKDSPQSRRRFSSSNEKYTAKPKQQQPDGHGTSSPSKVNGNAGGVSASATARARVPVLQAEENEEAVPSMSSRNKRQQTHSGRAAQARDGEGISGESSENSSTRRRRKSKEALLPPTKQPASAPNSKPMVAAVPDNATVFMVDDSKPGLVLSIRERTGSAPIIHTQQPSPPQPFRQQQQQLLPQMPQQRQRRPLPPQQQPQMVGYGPRQQRLQSYPSTGPMAAGRQPRPPHHVPPPPPPRATQNGYSLPSLFRPQQPSERRRSGEAAPTSSRSPQSPLPNMSMFAVGYSEAEERANSRTFPTAVAATSEVAVAANAPRSPAKSNSTEVGVKGSAVSPSNLQLWRDVSSIYDGLEANGYFDSFRMTNNSSPKFPSLPPSGTAERTQNSHVGGGKGRVPKLSIEELDLQDQNDRTFFVDDGLSPVVNAEKFVQWEERQAPPERAKKRPTTSLEADPEGLAAAPSAVWSFYDGSSSMGGLAQEEQEQHFYASPTTTTTEVRKTKQPTGAGSASGPGSRGLADHPLAVSYDSSVAELRKIFESAPVSPIVRPKKTLTSDVRESVQSSCELLSVDSMMAETSLVVNADDSAYDSGESLLIQPRRTRESEQKQNMSDSWTLIKSPYMI